jgi:hypothetical protein
VNLPDAEQREREDKAWVRGYKDARDDARERIKTLEQALEDMIVEANYVAKVRPDITFAVWVHTKATAALKGDRHEHY